MLTYAGSYVLPFIASPIFSIYKQEKKKVGIEIVENVSKNKPV